MRDAGDSWSEDAPDAGTENRWLDSHDWTDFSRWHLGVDPAASEDTKGRFSFPFGDFRKVHRCAVIAAESRAAQFDHPQIALADVRAEVLKERGSESEPHPVMPSA